MNKEPITVSVERDLEDLIPGFLKRREEDLAKLRNALQTGEIQKTPGPANPLQ